MAWRRLGPTKEACGRKYMAMVKKQMMKSALKKKMHFIIDPRKRRSATSSPELK